MDQRLPREIKAVRDRLEAIERERLALAEDELETRAQLLDEEHDLEARLARLIEEADRGEHGEVEERPTEHTDLTPSPRLPDAGTSY